VLTVATAFIPAPGFWEGIPPTQGFEAQLAAELAKRLGLQRVHVIRLPFADIAAGKLGGADLGLSQITETKERDKTADFAGPYLVAPPGILARVGVDASDVHELRQLRWVESRVSTLTPIVEREIRPRDPVVVEDRADALRVLRSGGADTLLLDLPVALGLAWSEPGHFHVIAQLPGAENLSAVLPEGSSNSEVVDTEIRALVADGTIGTLAKRWLGDSSKVPLIRTRS
jgi:ABC-type amino acid transport substrate-binding protein